MRVSQVLDASLDTCHALRWTPADLRRTHQSVLSVLASGPLTPSPSALGRFSPSRQITGLYQASGSAVFPVAYVVPCVRFHDVVRMLIPDVCAPAFAGSLGSLVSLPQRRGFLALTVTPQTDLSSSFIMATLGMGGWLALSQQGLSSCKKRQASLGALTVWLIISSGTSETYSISASFL
jgi:hypothetical protein